MRRQNITLLAFASLTLLCVCMPGITEATTLTVSKVCSNPSSTTCFTTITAAINNANITTNDNIVIEPGTYTESITLKNNLPISGVETARTILQNPGSSTAAITANGLTSVSISNLTISSTSVGIQVINSTSVTSVTIFNNVFWGSNLGTAILLQNNSTGQIFNNTFFQNQIAISSPVDITIQNNIFSTNGTALAATGTLIKFGSVSFNDFYNNTNMGPFDYDSTNPLETNIPNPTYPTNADANPNFVVTNATPPNMDLHLQEGSPCIATGSGAPPVDMGAFGGLGADTIPFIISGVTGSSQPGSGSATISWSANKSYDVTNLGDPTKQGGYNVHYSLNRSGPPYDAKTTVLSTLTSTIISGLTTTATKPTAPVLALAGFANQTLLLSWTTDPTASKYIIYYTDTDAAIPTEQFTEVSNTVTFPYALTGLVNLHHYSVQVTTVAQPTYYFSVTAFDYTVKGTNGGNPGVSHESAYSPDLSIAVGSTAESDRSNMLPAADTFPEAITPYPALPNKGCFIATAAYGSYSASEVQALRLFRDRYLMTTGPGRIFVRWYYTHGPRGAQFLNDHPEWKPVVRAALLPAVGMALFLTHTSAMTKMLVVLLIGLSLILFFYRKKPLPSGGVQ